MNENISFGKRWRLRTFFTCYFCSEYNCVALFFTGMTNIPTGNRTEPEESWPALLLPYPIEIWPLPPLPCPTWKHQKSPDWPPRTRRAIWRHCRWTTIISWCLRRGAAGFPSATLAPEPSCGQIGNRKSRSTAREGRVDRLDPLRYLYPGKKSLYFY